MKKLTFLCALMLAFSALAFGQKEMPNFAGTWTLDVDNSELGQRSRVKSMKMTVTQSPEELSYERKAEREPSEGTFGGGRRGQGAGGRRGFGGGSQASTFDLSGKETTAPAESNMGVASKLKAELKEGLLKLTQKREFNTPRGEMTITTVERWSLSEDGKTLTISSEMETPRGNRSSKMVFTYSE